MNTQIKNCNHVIAIAFLMLLSGLNAQAACFSTEDSIISMCRHPIGDSWCVENSGKPYAYKDECLRNDIKPTQDNKEAGVKQKNPKKPSLTYEDKLRQDAQKVVREQLQALHDKTNTTDSPDKRNIKGFVLSTEVRSFREVPESIDQEIQAMRLSIRDLIFRVATDIEQNGSSGKFSISDDGAISYEELPEDAVTEYKRLMEAKQQNNVAVRSVQLAIQMLSNINKSLMDEAIKQVKIPKKRKLYIMQAALVYEMSVIVSDFLDKIELDGKEELLKISKEHQNIINQRISNIEELVQRSSEAKEKGIIKPETAEAQTRSSTLMIEANKQTLQAWQGVTQQVSKQDNALQDIKSKKEAIDIIKDSAKVQLDTLRDIAIVGELQSFIDDTNSLITAIEGLELLELTPETVKTLLFGNQVYEGRDLKK